MNEDINLTNDMIAGEIIITNEDIDSFITGELPIEYFPDEMFHFSPKNAWDHWENERHQRHWENNTNIWNKKLCAIRRQIKLYKKILNICNYCQKSDINYCKWLSRRYPRKYVYIFEDYQYFVDKLSLL